MLLYTPSEHGFRGFPSPTLFCIFMTGSPASSRNKVLLLLILFLDLMGFTLIFPLVPDMLEHYLAQARHLAGDGWLIAAGDYLQSLLPADRQDDRVYLIVLLGGVLSALYSFIQFLAAPYWGRLSDRIGRRPVLLLTSGGLAASYVLWFFSQSFTMFVLSRVLGGLMSGNMGVASAAMADITAAEDCTKAMGMVGAAFGMGFIVGPVIGGLSAIPAESLMHLLPEVLHPFSAPALVAFLLSAGSAVLNLLWFQETLTVRSGADHVWIANPVARLVENLRLPGFGDVLFINFVYIIIFSAYEFTFTFLYKLEFGLSPAEIGFVFLYLGVVLVLGQGGLVRALSKRLPSRNLLWIGLALIPVPMYFFAWTPPSVAWSLVVLFPFSIGASLVQPALAGLASLSAPADRQGLSLGLLRSAGSLGRAIGPLAGAYAYWTFGYETTYLCIAVLLFLTLLYSLKLKSSVSDV